MPPPIILDPNTLDLNHVVADQEKICSILPHRGEMLHLNAVVYMDTQEHIIAGYKDVRDNEFWVPGHFPGNPILPGVIQCETAAQLLAFYAVNNKVVSNVLLGLGGLENVRFRSAVRPGDRLIIIAKGSRVDRRQTIFHTQGFAQGKLAFHADVIGVPILDYSKT